MIARRLLQLAIAILPAHRKPWGAAMLSELDAVPGPEALSFALGCLWAACSERISVMKLIVSIGRWGVGLVTVAYGGLFLYGLVGNLIYPNPQITHVSYLPLLRVWMVFMALSPLAAGFFLIRWRPRLFTLSCLAMAVPGIGMIAAGLWVASKGLYPHLYLIGYAWPLLPLAMLVTAAAFLAWLDGGKPRAAVAAI